MTGSEILISTYPNLFRPDGRAYTELGLFSGEGCIESGVYTAYEAVEALARYPEDELDLEPMCMSCGNIECECAEGDCECEDYDDGDAYDDESDDNAS